jgi:TldD protein
VWTWLFVTAAADPSVGPPPAPPSEGAAPAGGSLEASLSSELARAAQVLAQREEKPHYISLSVQDWEQVTLAARDGTLAVAGDQRVRYLDVDVRTGTPELDSTHPLRGFSALADQERYAIQVPLDDGYPLRHAVWRQLDEVYRAAAERIVVLRTNQDVKVEEEDPAPDFEPRAPVVDRRATPALTVERAKWEGLLVALSEQIERAPEVQRGAVTLQVDRVEKTFVDTEGTRLVQGRLHARFSISVAAVAPDGDEVDVYDAIDASDPVSLPDAAALTRRVEAALDALRARLAAPRVDPYAGPVLLAGRAAGVFFHEVLGHRVEGHRQKRDDEGKTFADQIGRRVLPEWLDVYDDPTLPRLAGEDLNGFYAYDDEGVPAARANLIDDGVFVGFLLQRSPIPGFPTSNGHGRRSTGNAAEARMGNTIVSASRTSSTAQLRTKLTQLAKVQGLAYGYLVDEIDGGFTMTGRVTPNAFNVRASSVWRVYVDGRPDERVRGLDLVGTPLVAFTNIVAAGDDPAVFNGVCGSDSGWVPVSAVAPSLLFTRLEFQLKEKGEERPPLLAKPSAGDAAAEAL